MADVDKDASLYKKLEAVRRKRGAPQVTDLTKRAPMMKKRDESLTSLEEKGEELPPLLSRPELQRQMTPATETYLNVPGGLVTIGELDKDYPSLSGKQGDLISLYKGQDNDIRVAVHPPLQRAQNGPGTLEWRGLGSPRTAGKEIKHRANEQGKEWSVYKDRPLYHKDNPPPRRSQQQIDTELKNKRKAREAAHREIQREREKDARTAVVVSQHSASAPPKNKPAATTTADMATEAHRARLRYLEQAGLLPRGEEFEEEKGGVMGGGIKRRTRRQRKRRTRRQRKRRTRRRKRVVKRKTIKRKKTRQSRRR